MTATIKDVAKRAGVSTATVSHVINNTRFVSDATREIVENAIQELSYRPNSIARSFKTGQNHAIGVIIPDISNLFFATVIEEIEAVASRHKYTIMISNTHENKVRERNALEYFSRHIVDGILLASTFDDYSELAPFLPPDIPLVFFDRVLKSCPYDSITTISSPCILQLLQQLSKEGHEKIGFIGNLPHLSTTMEHLKLYREVLEPLGLYQNGRYVRYASAIDDSGYTSAQALLNGGCTALFVASNVATRGVLKCILDAGLLPEKNIPVLAPYNADFLALTIRFFPMPQKELGQQAGQMILSRIQHPDASIQQIQLSSNMHL